MADSYDLIIIGAGPGGYVAAIRAAQLGLKTAIVEREHMAGICSNWGCIPTKALLRTAEIYGHMAHAKDYGLTAEKFGFDLDATVKRSRQIAAQMNNGVQFLMKKNKVDTIWGEAALTGPGEIKVEPTKKPAMQPQVPPPKNALGPGTYKARNIIVATGARPRILPGIEPDGDRIWTYFEAMTPKGMPKSLVVMGSGAIGMEFASFYRSLGADVTIIELLPQILPVEDAEIAAHVKKRFEKRGIRFMTEAKVAKVDKSKTGIVAHVELKDGSQVDVAGVALISAVRP
jgi:dihydrolipoamide dehydrogenase